MTADEIRTDTEVAEMTDAEIKTEYAWVRARLDEMGSIIDPTLIPEIKALRDYLSMLKGTVLARR